MENHKSVLIQNLIEVITTKGAIIDQLVEIEHNLKEFSAYEIVEELERAVKAHDEYTGGHNIRVCRYSVKLSELIGEDSAFIEDISIQGRLHDVGKLAIDPKILKKKSKLTDEERKIMKRHPEYGAIIIGNRPDLALAKQIALYHSEQWGGGGYPYSLRGKDIPLAARITCITDAFDSLVTKRSYKPAFSYDWVFNFISNRNNCYDPKLKEIFLNKFDIFIKINEENKF